MTDTLTHSPEAGSGASAPLEKIALETYVPLAKPSLVGLSRAESAAMVETVLGEISDVIADGETVKLSSFGSFVVRAKGERVGLEAGGALGATEYRRAAEGVAAQGGGDLIRAVGRDRQPLLQWLGYLAFGREAERGERRQVGHDERGGRGRVDRGEGA